MNYFRTEGSVCINYRNGDMFLIKPVKRKNSLLDLKGINIKIFTSEIVDVVKEGRKLRD